MAFFVFVFVLDLFVLGLSVVVFINWVLWNFHACLSVRIGFIRLSIAWFLLFFLVGVITCLRWARIAMMMYENLFIDLFLVTS